MIFACMSTIWFAQNRAIFYDENILTTRDFVFIRRSIREAKSLQYGHMLNLEEESIALHKLGVKGVSHKALKVIPIIWPFLALELIKIITFGLANGSACNTLLPRPNIT